MYPTKIYYNNINITVISRAKYMKLSLSATFWKFLAFWISVEFFSGQFNYTFNYNETREERELDLILSSCVENFLEFSLVTFSVPPPLSLGDISFALFVMSLGLF